MYLKHVPSGNLVEILEVAALADPCREGVVGRFHAGEELQDAAVFPKAELAFPSGEGLPRCWTDPEYRLR